MNVEIHRLSPDIEMPRFHTSGSVGFDIAASEELVLSAKTIGLVKTGLVIKTPKGFALLLASRSSTPKKKGLTPPHGIGIIDQDYCGINDEIRVLVRNFTDTKVVISKGERIAQGLFVKIEVPSFVETDLSGEKNRGGFGSTGSK